MPELPEVTVISEDVRALAAGKKVVRAEVFRDDVSNVGAEGFGERLAGRVLSDVRRCGKVIVLDFGDVVGLVHLVISGRVERLPAWRDPDKVHTAVVEFGDAAGGAVVLAFGDADNDIDMLRFAGLGVAVGGMTDEVRAAADVVAPPADEDGVAAFVGELLRGER